MRYSQLCTYPCQIIAMLIAGAIGCFAFAPYQLWPLGLISIIALLYSSHAHRSWTLGFFWGVGLFASGISWISVSIQQFGGVPPLIAYLLVALSVCYLSLYPLVFNFVVKRFFPRATLISLLFAAPAIWQLTEYLRGIILGGFPWLQFGYSQLNGPLHTLAPISGVNGITLLLFFIAGLMTVGIRQKTYKPIVVGLIVLCLPLTLLPLKWTTVDTSRTAHFSLIQGDILPTLHWDPDYLAQTLNTYETLTLPHLQPHAIVIWPEAAIPDLEKNQAEFLTLLDQRLKQTQSSLMMGIIAQQKTHFYNRLIVLDPQQAPYHYPARQYYNKHHLVPFGEYTPFAFIFTPLTQILNIPMSDLAAGAYQQPHITINGFNFLPTICYEVIFNQQVRDNFTPKTDFLLTISNDSWFGSSIGPWQHLQMSQMRALELGRPLIRATSNGITTIIDSSGHLVSQLPQFTAQVLTATVSPSVGITPFARWGNTPYWLCTLIFCVIAIIARYYQRRHRSSADPSSSQ